MKTKICGTCKKELPATLVYYYKRTDYKNAIYLRSSCIKCTNKKGTDRYLKIQIKKYGTYNKDVIKKIASQKTADKIRIYDVSFNDDPKYHSENLTDAYIRSIVNRNRTSENSISIHTLRKYPNIIKSVRDHILLIRAFGGRTRLPKIHPGLFFNGDKIKYRRYISNEGNKESCIKITDTYCRQHLKQRLQYNSGVRLKTEDISKELIELTRSQIKLVRTIKNKQNETK